LVIGDIMLDHYIFGDCNRISPEAPVPVVEVKTEDYSLGGAGNVVKNLSAFGSLADIISVVGNDKSSQIIFNELSKNDIVIDKILIDNERFTTVKTRVLVAKHQLIRLDSEMKMPVSSVIEKKLLKLVEENIKNYHILLVSDYGKGLLTQNILQGVFNICRKNGVKTIVDPKGTDFAKYKGVNIIKPNKKEVVNATGIQITDKDSLQRACKKIEELTGCDAVIVTMSEEGIALYTENKLTTIPTKAIDVVDVTGAGDTVLASLGLALAHGQSLLNACGFANRAAAIVVSKVGSATATLEEIGKIF